MARRSNQDNPETLRQKLIELLTNFETHLQDSDLRTQVQELVPANYLLRDLGSSLVAGDNSESARDRILLYLRKHPVAVIHGDELMVVAGISEYARRIRELRVEHGWPIISGVTVSEMRKDAESEGAYGTDLLPNMGVDEYMLMLDVQDRDAAHRWNIANDIRKEKVTSVRGKILKYFRKNIGTPISGEELRYVVGNKSEWARRTRELRTEYGWPIATKLCGRPDLPISVYILEEDRQYPPHDRKIKDATRRAVLKRDGYSCQKDGCEWNHDLWNPSDPRHLEVHHIQHHAKGGSNEEANLVTYCNICHDGVHRDEGSEKK